WRERARLVGSQVVVAVEAVREDLRDLTVGADVEQVDVTRFVHPHANSHLLTNLVNGRTVPGSVLVQPDVHTETRRRVDDDSLGRNFETLGENDRPKKQSR